MRRIVVRARPSATAKVAVTNGYDTVPGNASAATKGKESEDNGEGLPGWAWGLIGAAIAGLVAWAIVAHRARNRPPGEGPPTAPPPPAAG